MRFCGAWKGLSRYAAANAIPQLLEHDVMRVAGHFGEGRRKCALYWPGRGPGPSHDELIERLKDEFGAVELDEPEGRP